MTAVSRGARISGRGWQPLALPRAVRMELDGEPELPVDIPVYQNSDSPETAPSSSQGSASLELSVTRVWESSPAVNPHICSALSEVLGCSG